MSLLAPTFPQIRALVTAIRTKFKDANVIGIRASSRWTGASRVEEQGTIYLLRQCDSPLEMRVALREEAEPGAICVLVTSLDQADLGDDLLLRLARRKLFPVDPWQIVRTLFQAQAIDPRLTRHTWLAERLLEALPPDDCRPAPGGFLDAEAVWPMLLAHSIGLTARRPDLNAILKWSLDSADVARFRMLSTDFRDAAVEWLADLIGNAARIALRCALASERPDALPVALAAGCIFHPETTGRLERSVGRLEQRYLDGTTANEESIRRLSAAATVVQRQLSEPLAARQLQRADEILREIGAEPFAYLSDTSPLGFDQRMTALGARIDRVLEQAVQPTVADVDSTETLLALRAAHKAVRVHELAAHDPRRLETIDMAVRLTEWFVRTSQASLWAPSNASIASNISSFSPSAFAAACSYQILEGGFVDWARLALRSGDPVRALSDAFRHLTDAVREIREMQAREFAGLLCDWTASGFSGDTLIPVEHVLAEIVAPLAAQTPVLLIVMDGMSVAVARELLADITNQDWVALRRENWGSMLGLGLAAIPSVTEVSRASLLCGQLCRGTSDLERNGFARHPEMLQHTRAGHPPLLFHKALLQEGTGANLSPEVRDAIVSAHKRIVGVVINAVDDQLLKGDQIATRWTCEEIKALPTLLYEARSAGRVVILLSDHGHILESGTQSYPREGGERWRQDDGGAPLPEELQVRGSRVVMPDNHKLIAPWSERIRYGGKKNGYHGGLSPQEMVVPIVVLCSTRQYPDGWIESISDTPTWWVDPFLEAKPRREVREAPVINRRRASTLILELDDESNAPQYDGQADESPPAWITQLLSSPLLTDQWRPADNSLSSKAEFAKLLDLLDNYGEVMPTSTLGRLLGCPPSRLNGLLTTAQRILNIDGFAILTRDSISDSIRLDRDLLRQQFDLD